MRFVDWSIWTRYMGSCNDPILRLIFLWRNFICKTLLILVSSCNANVRLSITDASCLYFLVILQTQNWAHKQCYFCPIHSCCLGNFDCYSENCTLLCVIYILSEFSVSYSVWARIQEWVWKIHFFLILSTWKLADT